MFSSYEIFMTGSRTYLYISLIKYKWQICANAALIQLVNGFLYDCLPSTHRFYRFNSTYAWPLSLQGFRVALQ